MLIEVGLSLLMTLVNAIVTALPTITTARLISSHLVTAFVTALPMLVTAGVSIITALVNAFVTMLPLILTAVYKF